MSHGGKKNEQLGRTKLVPDEGHGAWWKKDLGARRCGWGQADGEQLGPDTHIWRRGASGADNHR